MTKTNIQYMLKKTQEVKEETRVMRIYKPDADGIVNYDKYDTEQIIPTQGLPQGTFIIGFDYAIEDINGELLWLQCARLYKGEEYGEFSGIRGFENPGKVIWRK